MPVAVIGGSKTWYEIKGEGPPLLVIGGFAIGHSQGEAAAEYLAKKFQVILWDPRGQGLSERNIPEHYTVWSFANDLKSLMDYLSIPKMHIWSTFSGMIAIHFAVKHPSRIGGLITHPTGGETRRQATATHAAIVEFFGFRAMVRIITNSLGLSPEDLHSENGQAIEDWITSNIEKNTSVKDYLKMCQVMLDADFNFAGELPRLKAPTLFLAGRSGRLGSVSLTAEIETILKALPGSQLKTIEGGGTAFMVQEPEAASAIVTDFLNGIPL